MSIQLLTQGLKKAAGGGYAAASFVATDMSTAMADSAANIPAHSADDFILVAGYNESSGDALSATPPTDWATAAFNDDQSQSCEIAAYTIEDGTGSLSSVTVSALRMWGTIIYQADTGGTLSVGAAATLAGNSTSPSIPGLTLDVTDGSSVVVAGCIHEIDDGTMTFGSMTQRGLHTNANKSAYLLSTSGGVSSFSQIDETSSGAAQQWASFAVELKTT